MEERIEEIVTLFYLESRDFNGISYVSLLEQVQADEEELKAALQKLVGNERIEILYGDYHPNPFIKAYADTDKMEQILKLDDKDKLRGVVSTQPNLN